MLNTIKQAIERIEIGNQKQANLLYNLIPSACPFARTLKLGTFELVIPPLCKINPFYDNLMMLRFKAQCYLAEVERI
jgi:hypothetical protein